jgi:hypothetical protein
VRDGEAAVVEAGSVATNAVLHARPDVRLPRSRELSSMFPAPTVYFVVAVAACGDGAACLPVAVWAATFSASLALAA